MTSGLLRNLFNTIQAKIIGADNMTSYDVELGTLEIAGFSKEKLLEMSNFSKISYGSNDPKLSEAGYKTKAEFINEGYSIIPFYYSNGTHAGFVFAKDREITIAYHGTQNLDNVITNFNAFFAVPSFLLGGARTHRGFYNALKSSFDSLYSVLENCAKEQELRIQDFEINFTGHSMGGAIARIAALCFYQTENAQNLHVATFGAPRVFDLTASEIYNNVLRKSTIRVECIKDPVTKVPFDFCGYAHGNDTKLGVQKPLEHNIHTVDSYYHGTIDSDFKENESFSPCYYPVRALNVINCAILGNIQYVLAKSIGTYFLSELERDWSRKAMENIRNKPGQFLSCVNSEKFSTYPTVLNI